MGKTNDPTRMPISYKYKKGTILLVEHISFGKILIAIETKETRENWATFKLISYVKRPLGGWNNVLRSEEVTKIVEIGPSEVETVKMLYFT